MRGGGWRRPRPRGGEGARRTPGSARGKIVLAEDFDAPLPEDLLDAFER